MFYSLTIVLLLPLASQTLADGVVYGHQSSISRPNEWFNFERMLLNDEEPLNLEDESTYQDVKYRAKRSAYYPTKGYGHNQLWQGSRYGQIKSGYGHIKSGYGLQCYSIYRTTTDQWCEDNCRTGYCPQTHCACTGGSVGSIGSSYVPYPSKSGQYYDKLGSYGNAIYQSKTTQKHDSNYGSPIVQQHTTDYK